MAEQAKLSLDILHNRLSAVYFSGDWKLDYINLVEFPIWKDPQCKLDKLIRVDQSLQNQKFIFNLRGSIHGQPVIASQNKFGVIIDGKDILDALTNRISSLTNLIDKVGGAHPKHHSNQNSSGYKLTAHLGKLKGRSRIAFEFFLPFSSKQVLSISKQKELAFSVVRNGKCELRKILFQVNDASSIAT